MKIPPKLIAWSIAAFVMCLHWTCRVRVTNDPRPALKASGRRYVYSILHAHQIAAAINTEPETAAMVSQSGDGDLLVPMFRGLGVTLVRGSSRTKGQERGGASAIAGLVEHVSTNRPAIIAVDGPRGPRGRVRKGIASLARQTDAAILNVVLMPRQRLTIAKAWDRFQVPMPFSCVDAYFAEPIVPAEGEGVESIRRRVELSLNRLEAEWDPSEARHTSADYRTEAVASQDQVSDSQEAAA